MAVEWRIAQKVINLLIVEDDEIYANFLVDILTNNKRLEIKLTRAEDMASAVKLLSNELFDLILLDLDLPDSKGYDTFSKIHGINPECSIIILTNNDDIEIAVKAAQNGAHDYLIKIEIQINILIRSIIYALERSALCKTIKELSLTDELTGLNNRRGFTLISQQTIKNARRLNKTITLYFIDMDNLKWINDNLGHDEGDSAIKDLSYILKTTFRESDVIARLGGDEFAILTLADSNDDMGALLSRLHENLRLYKLKNKRKYNLSFSTGIIQCIPGQNCSLSDLLKLADERMYEEKKNKKKK